VKWRLEFCSEWRQILADCRVEAPQDADAWVLYRIQRDE
jgi:hypothetical protein